MGLEVDFGTLVQARKGFAASPERAAISALENLRNRQRFRSGGEESED